MANKQIKIIKNRSDIGAGTRGSDMGIDAIEVAAINKGSDYFNQYPYEDLETDNETVYNKVNNSFAKRIRYVYEQCSRVCQAVHKSLENGYFPIVLSGDHSSALGTMSGVKQAFPNQRMGVVWIDAHADLHSPYTSPSGNVHGMPLAAGLSTDNLDSQINNVTTETGSYWEKMKNLGKEGPKVLPQDLVYFGVRDTEAPEEQEMEELGIRNYTVDETRFRGLELCISEALERLSDCPLIYISFDVDSMDCDRVSYGTGTPVPRGFDPAEVQTIINQIIDSGKVVCLELVEVNPLLDMRGNQMAETAFDLLDGLTNRLLSVLKRSAPAS